MSKLITVFGATGVQGGSVVNAILARPILSKEFKVRAITRDPSKPNAQGLRSRGVETVKADLEHSESVTEALKDSYAVFAVTNYWEKRSKQLEVEQGKTVAHVCKAVGVKHLIWSALPHVSKMTNGVLKGVEHFDSKSEVAEYIETTKGDMVATYFMPAFYMQNIKGMIRPGRDGVPILIQPWDGDKTKVALLDAAKDSGPYVAGILSQDPQSVNGVYVQACSEWITPNEMVDVLSKTSGTKVKFQQVPENVFKGFLPPPVAEEMTENIVLVRDCSYVGPGQEKRQPESDRILGGMKKTTWEEFVRANGPWTWSTEGVARYDHL